jgi:hypothetical protein
MQDGTFKASQGQFATSLSNAGNSSKPMAIIKGTIREGNVTHQVVLHVHFDAINPLDTFTGANAKVDGATDPFASWAAGAVSTTAWLRTLLNANLPNWSKQNAWSGLTPVPGIVWQQKKVEAAGWENAQRVAARVANADYTVTFRIGTSQKIEAQVPVVEGFAKGKAKVVVRGANNRVAELTFPNEQEAFLHLTAIEADMRSRWSTTSAIHTPPTAWS